MEESPSVFFMLRGFKANVPGGEFNPADNWYGVSKYLPDASFIRGEKKIILSLQGMLMPEPPRVTGAHGPAAFNTPEWNLVNACAARYVGFFENGIAMYQDWGGRFPDKDFIEAFTAR